MNRNVESRFAKVPGNVDISRSQFDRSFRHSLTFNVGDIVPFYIDEVLPGDTFNIKTSKVVRLPALLKPLMDNLYLDTYYFYCPNRLVWKHWKEFMGEPADQAWVPKIEYQIPQIYPATIDPGEATEHTYSWYTGSVADYFGIPVGVPGLRVSALPFRVYSLCCNEWFRDENLSDPLVTDTGDSDIAVVTGDGDMTVSGVPTELERPGLGLTLYKASKYHDLFTSALPAPQRGVDVSLPLSGNAPVFASDGLSADFADYYDRTKNTDLSVMKFKGASSALPSNDYRNVMIKQTELQVYQQEGSAPSPSYTMTPSNLIAYLQDVNSASVNQLRIAFQLQKFYEKASRGGARYTEILKSQYGVTAPDASLQRPEYLGGNRIPITINQIIQQSMTSGSNPLGEVAAMSLTTDNHGDFIRSFTEHGWIIGVMVARYDHTYQQGLNRMFSRRDRFDIYYPVFANLGEMPILNKEIYAQGPAVKDDGNVVDEQVFGYQEAWADYRYYPNRVSGFMRSNPFGVTPGSIDVWHLADDYSSLPYLSDSWIREDADTVNRVLSVSNNTSGFQLFADVYVHNRCTRPMPVFSVPGLIDHH